MNHYYYLFYFVKELGFLSHSYNSINILFTSTIKYIYKQLMSREAARTITKSKIELSATSLNLLHRMSHPRELGSPRYSQMFLKIC